MFRNYVSAALRNMARNPFYSLINIGGLSLGFAAAFMIALFVRDELIHDQFFPSADELFRIEMGIHVPDRTPIDIEFADARVLPQLMLETPEIIVGARLQPDQRGVRAGTGASAVEAIDAIQWTDPDFFKCSPSR